MSNNNKASKVTNLDPAIQAKKIAVNESKIDYLVKKSDNLSADVGLMLNARVPAIQRNLKEIKDSVAENKGAILSVHADLRFLKTQDVAGMNKQLSELTKQVTSMESAAKTLKWLVPLILTVGIAVMKLL